MSTLRPAPRYRIIALGALPDCSVGWTTRINARSQLIGSCPRNTGDRQLSYIWERGALRSLGTLGGGECDANDLNESGQAVGRSRIAAGPHRAFLWENDCMTDLGTLGGEESAATALNNRGQIVGYADTREGKSHPALWDKNGIHDLSSQMPVNSLLERINNHEQMIIKTSVGIRLHSFFFDHGKLTRICPESDNCFANSLNQRGEVVGFRDVDGEGRAFVWRDGQTIDLGTLGGGDSSSASDIDNNGEIVGVAYNHAEGDALFYGEPAGCRTSTTACHRAAGGDCGTPTASTTKARSSATANTEGNGPRFCSFLMIQQIISDCPDDRQAKAARQAAASVTSGISHRR